MSRIATAVLPAFALLVSTGAAMAEPVSAHAGLDRTHFRQAVLPSLKPGVALTVYADEARFSRLFAEVVAPRFARSHGMVVRFVVKPSDVIIAELANARDAGVPAPADLVLLGERDQRRLVAAGLDAGLDLVGLLPNARDIGWTGATVADASHTGGATVPFHVARQVVAYDSAAVKPDQIADLAGLANYASVNPGRLGYARPSENGARASFAETVTIALASPVCLSRIYDTEMTPGAAADYAGGACGVPAVNYFRSLRLHASVTRTPAEVLLRLARGDVKVAVTGQDDIAEAAARGALPASIRVTTIPGQVAETVGLAVAGGTPNAGAALALADDLMSAAVQQAKLDRFGSASARPGIVPSSATASWFATPVAADPTVRNRPVSTLATAMQRRLAAEVAEFAAR